VRTGTPVECVFGGFEGYFAYVNYLSSRSLLDPGTLVGRDLAKKYYEERTSTSAPLFDA